MGYGESFYYALSNKFGGYAYIFAGILLISGFVFYILDVGEWHSAIGNIFRFTCMAGMFVVFVIIIMLVSNEHPFGLIALFALLNPLWMLMVKSIFYRSRDARTFVSWLSGPLLFISLLTAASFIAWICLDYDNEWNSVTRVEAAIRTGCEPNYNEYPNCQNADGSGATCFYVDYSTHPQELAFPDNCDSACLNVYNDCANGFILFSGPILMCLSMLFLAFFCTFLRTGEYHAVIIPHINSDSDFPLPCNILANYRKRAQMKMIYLTLASFGSSYYSSCGQRHLYLEQLLALHPL